MSRFPELDQWADQVDVAFDEAGDFSFLTDDEIINLGAFLAVAVRESWIEPTDSGAQTLVTLVSALFHGEDEEDEDVEDGDD